MTKILLSFFLTLSILDVFAQNNPQTIKATEKSFPTNLNPENFSTLKKLEDKIVAYNGTIEKIENSRHNTPCYKLRIGDNSYLWTILMFKNAINKIGDTIRVVGYMTRTEPNESEKQYLDVEYKVVSFGLVDFKNSKFLFLPGADIQKQEWIDGKIPSSK